MNHDDKFTIDPNKLEQDIARSVENSRKAEEARKKRLTELVSLTVGTHAGCGGAIVYTSEFLHTGSMNDIRFGAKIPLDEISKCSCTSCGALFDTGFTEYRSQITKYRNRTK